MDGSALIALLQQAVPGATIEPAPSVDLHTAIAVSRDHVPDVARVLRDTPDLRFTFLAELTAVDVWPREPRFEVIYVLDGAQSDERGTYSAGSLVVNREGDRHSVWSDDGCLVLIVWERPIEFL